MQLDVISDTVCPWCYIGKKRLDRALADAGRDASMIRWRPFQLDPTIPQGGVDRKAYLERKFGPQRMKSAGDAIREAGALEGINFAFDKIERSPNTLDSHRLIRWAGTAGVQNAVVDILFRRYFEQGEDIGDHDVLVDAAREAGMDSQIVRDLLATDADTRLVQEEEYLAREMGVQGVPCFLFNQMYFIVGAQDSETLVRLFRKIEQKEAEAAASS